MATIVKERYIITDARNRRKLHKYASIITYAAKSAKLKAAEHIIMLIYNRLDLEFQKDILMPSLTTPLEHFLQKLNNYKDT